MMALSTLLPLLSLDVANVPSFIAITMLRLSVQEFCRESDYWQETDEVLLDGSSEYVLAYSSRVKPCRIVKVFLDDDPEPLKAQVDYSEPERGVIKLKNPLDSGKLSILMSVQPKNDENEIDDDLADYYQQSIVAGAVARLLRMPSQPWTDKREVKRHQDIFSTGYRAARRERLDKNARHTKKKRRHTFY